MTITFESKAWKSLKDDLDFIKTMLKVALAKAGNTKWIFEDEVMVLTRLKKSSLQKLRRTDVFRSRTVTGKKILYLRSDVMAYVDGIPRAPIPYTPHKMQMDNTITNG